jgi:hypothetical protein
MLLSEIRGCGFPIRISSLKYFATAKPFQFPFLNNSVLKCTQVQLKETAVFDEEPVGVGDGVVFGEAEVEVRGVYF